MNINKKNLINMNIEENKKTILFAPNAFGKTILSNELYNKLKNKNMKVEIFTAKRINELVNVRKKQILIGDSAQYRSKNADIEKKLNASFFKILMEFSKEKYSVKNATNLMKISYFFSDKKISNFKNSFSYFYTILNNHKTKIEGDYNCEYIFEIDKELAGLSFNLPNITSVNLEDNIFKKDNIVFTDDDYSAINKIFNFIKRRKVNKCPVCGTKFSDNKELISHVIKEISNIDSQTQSELYKSIISEWDKVEEKHKKDSHIWKYVKKYDSNDIKIILGNLINYKLFINHYGDIYIECFYDYISKKLNSSKISYKKELNIYSSNLEKINTEDQKINSNINFMTIVKEEFNKLVDLPKTIYLDQTKAYELKIMVDNKLKYPSEILSESELKRLTLAVLNAIIIEKKSEYVILDDPIDSYDDYYTIRAINYIFNSILSNVNNWFIATHQFQFVYQLSKLLKEDNQDIEIFYSYYNPNFIKVKNRIDNPKKIITQIRIQDMRIFVDDEMIILKNIINRKRPNSPYHIDKTFAYLSMFNIIRTFKNELINNIVYTYDRNKKVQKKVNLIEKSYLHYSLDKKTSMKDINYILLKWVRTNGNIGITKANINKFMIDLRLKYLNKDFEKIQGNNIVLKDVLYKILWITECKYNLDKCLYLICQKNYSWDTKSLRNLLTEAGFGLKIKYAIKKIMNPRNDILDLEKIYNRNKLLLNNYSHSASRLFPPYMVTSIKEISTFYNDIEHVLNSI